MKTTTLDSKVAAFCEGLIPTQLTALQTQQGQAQAFLDSNDFPTTRHERYKYTRLAKLANTEFSAFKLSDAATLQAYQLDADAYTVYIHGAQFELPSDLPKGLSLTLISQQNDAMTTELEDVFDALSSRYCHDGLVLHLADNTTLDKPIQIIQVDNGGKFFYKHHFSFGKNAEAKIWYAHFAQQASCSFSHTHLTIDVQEEARIQIDKLQAANDTHFAFAKEHIIQAQRSHFTINTYTLSGAFVRNEVTVAVAGQHAETHLNGAYLLKGQQHVANYTTIDHQVPNCESFENYRGIADEKASAVFNGKVFVRPDAQKTNAYQSNASIVLGPDASINSKPELEIYADDVKCSHGSTTGQLDENALFYLRARGIGETAARTLLLQAFMAEVLEAASPVVQTVLQQKISQRFHWEIQE
ncbi:MAG: Fe-S cluster assembly protein SufD [Bacteroidota bacterium]